MITILMAFLLSLFVNVLSGSVVHLLWNYGPGSFDAVPEMTWLTGVASFLLVRLIIAPPKVTFDFNLDN